MRIRILGTNIDTNPQDIVKARVNTGADTDDDNAIDDTDRHNAKYNTVYTNDTTTNAAIEGAINNEEALRYPYNDIDYQHV